MGSKNGKYEFHHEASLPSTEASVRPKKASSSPVGGVPTFIHHDVLRDTPADDVDRLSLVWLDADVYQRALNIDMEVKLKNLIGYVRLFERVDACERYIKQIGKINAHSQARKERLLVIISTALAMTLIPHLHELEQVKQIYIFGKAKSLGKGHQEWLRKYNKVKGLHTSSRSLIDQIAADQRANLGE